MKFKNFQESFLQEFLNQTEMSDVDKKQMLKNFSTSYSQAKHSLMIDQAILLYSNSRYFPFLTRLKIAKIILLGR